MSEHSRMLEAVLEKMGWDVYETRLEKNTWGIRKGSANAVVAITEPEKDGQQGLIFMWSYLAKIPNTNLVALYRYLLEKNFSETFTARFAIHDNMITLTGARSLQSISEDEMAELIAVVVELADKYDDYIIKEFGCIKIE